MLYKFTSILLLSALAKAAPQVVSPATMGGSCTTVTSPGETQAIVDSAGNTLSCDGSAYQTASTVFVTNVETATVTASGQGSAQTIVSTYMPAEPSYVPGDAGESAAIASATASINAAMAQATPAADKFLWRGALSVGTPAPDEELDFRGRVAEISEAIFSANRDWIPSRIFSASNYSTDITDPDEWLEVLAGNQPGHTAVVYESADKQNLYAQVTLWNGGEGNQLTVNTTWTPNSEHEPTQQWKDAIVSTLQLPIVQDALVKKGWPKDPSGLPRDDQSLLAYGMVYGQLPVKRIFKNDPLNGYAAALDAGYAGKYPTLVRSGTFAIAPIKTETTYIITGYSTTDDKKDWKVGLGIWKGQGQPEDAGVHAENIRLDDLLHSTEYVIHKQTDVLETTNCGWHGKKDGENYCP